MLPPIPTLALNSQTSVAESSTDTADQSGFSTSLAAFLRQAATITGSEPGLVLPTAAGRTLPPGGKVLPVQTMAGLPNGLQDLPPDLISADDIPVPPPAAAGTTETPLAAQPVGGPLFTVPPLLASAPDASASPSGNVIAALPAIEAGPPVATTPALSVLSATPKNVPAAPLGAADFIAQAAQSDGRVLPLPGAAVPTNRDPVATAKAAMPAIATVPGSSQEDAALALTAAVLRDEKSPALRRALHEAAIQMEAFDRKLAQTAPAAPTATAPVAGHPTAAPAAPMPGSPMPAALISPINLPPGADGWSDALGDRVVMMAGNKLQTAEIRLNPADLGPVRVQISVDDGTATVNFHAHHALTRDAIEQALPRLREMLGDQGLSLGGASVSDQGVQHDQAETNWHHGAAPGAVVDETAIASSLEGPARRTSALAPSGLVDLFA